VPAGNSARPIVLPSIFTLLLVLVTRMPASSLPSVSGSLLLAVPLLSAITLTGPITSDVPLGFMLAGFVLGFVLVRIPLLPLPTCSSGAPEDRPMRLPMTKFGRNTPPASMLTPLPRLPLMTLPGPMRLPKLDPLMLTPSPPFGMAALPVASRPMRFVATVTAAMFSLKMLTPLPPLPEITLSLISTG